MARNRSIVHIDKGVSIYLRPGSPFWQLRITSKGFRHRESLNTSDRDAAKDIARRRADSMLSNAEGIVVSRDRTYEELLENYKAHAELRNQPSTRKLNYDNLNRITRHFKRKLREQRSLYVSDFNLMALTSYANQRLKAGIKPVTLNREMGSLSSFFGRAIRSKLIRANPVADFDLLSVPLNRKPQTLTNAEVSRLLEAAAQPVPFHGRGQKGRGNSRSRLTPIWELILFILNTGARLAEAMYLEWDKVSLQDCTIHFANIPEHTIKTFEDRVVMGNNTVMEMLQPRKLKAGNRRWVFSDHRDKIFDRKNLLRELKRVATTARIKKVNFLKLRSTALTAWARSGIPPFLLKEAAGHADVRTSQRYYIGLVGAEGWLPPVVG